MISAEGDKVVVLIEQRPDRFRDSTDHSVAWNRFDVSGVENRRRAEINPSFAPEVR
jgi:hypothetical protein